MSPKQQVEFDAIWKRITAKYLSDVEWEKQLPKLREDLVNLIEDVRNDAWSDGVEAGQCED